MEQWKEAKVEKRTGMVTMVSYQLPSSGRDSDNNGNQSMPWQASTPVATDTLRQRESEREREERHR